MREIPKEFYGIFRTHKLRGPAAILSRSRDTSSDSIAQLVCACFFCGGGGYRTIVVRYVAKWGIAQICLCEIKCQEGYRTIWGSASLPKTVSGGMGIAIIVSQCRAIWGHEAHKYKPKNLGIFGAFFARTFVLKLGNENSAQSVLKSLRVVDVCAFGSWMSAPKCLFFQDFDCPDRSFGPGHPHE